jgi:hypothetical protein
VGQQPARECYAAASSGGLGALDEQLIAVQVTPSQADGFRDTQATTEAQEHRDCNPAARKRFLLGDIGETARFGRTELRLADPDPSDCIDSQPWV